MGARRPRTQPNTKPVEPEVFSASDSTEPATDAAPKDSAPKLEGIAYTSLRLRSNAGKLRYAANSLLVEATADQTITLYAEKVAPNGARVPYVHFKVMPSGVEIPPSNVASSVPSDSSVAQKLSIKSRMARRAEIAEQRMKELASENAQIQKQVAKERGTPGSIQEVPEEDDDLDESLDHDPEDDEADELTEGEEDDDGIDV